MSLNQKYTWADFLKENPPAKGKKIKRTSPEGKKAFDAAFKAKIKDILKDRLVWVEKETKRVGSNRSELTSEIKSSKKAPRKKVIQGKIGRNDKYLNRLGKVVEKTKQIQKSL